ncbi:MAG: branched-chain amino acid ABC transporter permease [Candidatus Tectomicrobia bacterium]|uniref:Branched-chain amino acid ABC transporter permease n=1 Tax=Tectimicrobiota bacterium TaxID=2528274 RepID=A0A938B2N2_UNCTE|nr:branched-chain amino acid ABC transporter permease [Candidatus Tectomicrobia bacterium]
MAFFLDLITNGLLVGLMYSLVAVGFVLIYKATSIMNFAQGDLVMFAGYIAAVMLGLKGMPIWLMVILLCAGMVLLGFVLERGILRPMVGQPLVSVIMVTIGLSFVLQGLVTIIWGGSTRELPLPVRVAPYTLGPALISPINLVAALIALLFLLAFGLFFTRSRLGVAMRAVADDQQASMIVGIRVSRVFALSWAIAGLAAAAGGIIWGNMLGVDRLLALVGLKVFPVVILGGLDSIGGAIVGGLIMGAVESVASGYLDPYVGGGTKDFIPYVLMILVLFIKPHGFFGHETIERV